ncbi:MAG: AAA family ATPase [Actinobacteria bacterium]|nr:AAA family ATPase [Actinomycetota bacterium]
MASAAASRRTVTVLFCDLADSTALGERLDPEALRLVLDRWYAAMREAIERHGGTVEKFIGDAVFAVFGIPAAHEDDALRAVRAALDMRAASGGVELRIGINTGEVVTGDETTTLVTGDAVNTAKRLEEAAADGEILVGVTTRELVRNAVELEELAPVAAKGKAEPVAAWRVLAAIPDAEAFARRLDSPLVGRREELERLRAELLRAEREQACRVVTVLGPAGIGKSRLASELLGSVEGEATVLRGRCMPYGDAASFAPIAALLDSEPETAEEALRAVRRALEALAAERPLVVCIEDIHWAAASFLDLLEYVAGWSRGAPILLLCLSRPELLDLRPRWPGAVVELEPLEADEAAALVEQLAEEWPLSPDDRVRAVETAEGNPLFLEQLVAMLADGTADRLPPTVQALLAARLDRLEPEDRAMLGRAAVVGREFTAAAVAELSSADERDAVSSALFRLVREQLLAPQPSGGDDAFRFRHALIRDAAYAGLPMAARGELHERVAGWLEGRGADDELVGYHLEQAHLCRVALAPGDDALAVRAGTALGRAGLRAAARGDAASARAVLHRSVALVPDGHPSRPELLRELSSALWTSGEVEAGEAMLTASIEAARAAGDTRAEWYGTLELAARHASTLGDTATLVAVAEQAVDVFGGLGDDLGLARAWRRLGLVSHTESRYAAAAAAFERAFAHAQASRDPQERARSADGLCSALLFGPTHADEAAARAQELLAAARGNAVLEAHVSTALAGLVAMQGEIDRARALYRAAGDVYDELGLRLPRAGWTGVAALVERLGGDPDAAVETLLEGHALLEGYDRALAYHAASLALLLASEGRGDDAAPHAAAARARLDHADAPTSARLHAAEALLSADRELARQAVEHASRTDDLNLQAEARLVHARVCGDPESAADARRLYEAKGNRAAAALLAVA